MLKSFVYAMLLHLGLGGGVAMAQGAAAPAGKADPFSPLQFLEGAWAAHAAGQGAAADGAYAFRRELDGHVLARHSETAGCRGPEAFDCEHGDLLYVFQDGPGLPLKAIFFDNEGHVIHYAVTVPEPNKVVFLSEAMGVGPQFRLMYALKGGSMQGSFAMLPPGQTVWRPYLEWAGAKQ
jgi:hypothetical protein